METTTPTKITVETTVNAPVEKVWKSWGEPEHIKNWCRIRGLACTQSRK